MKVKCDICQEPMKQEKTSYVCWPCKHIIYADQLYLYDNQVEVHILGATKEEMNDALGS